MDVSFKNIESEVHQKNLVPEPLVKVWIWRQKVGEVGRGQIMERIRSVEGLEQLGWPIVDEPDLGGVLG